MHLKWITFGIVLYLTIWIFLLPTRLAQDPSETFSHDAAAYNNGGVHVAEQGFYSEDGVAPALEREPGMSMFLGAIYWIFGSENRAAIFAAQGLLTLAAVIMLARELKRHVSSEAATVTFFLLITLPSIYHTIFSVYRENFALSLFLFTTTFLLQLSRMPKMQTAIAAGALLGMLLITYLPFLFLPILLTILLSFLTRQWKLALPILLVPYLFVGAWGFRNMHYTGTFQLGATERSAIMWYVRGLQAENVRGLEPLRCLWSEYISRDWTGRSPYCSYNGVMHQGYESGELRREPTVTISEGQKRILRNLPHHLWFSLVDTIELHIPFVNGWGRTYNILAAIGQTILLIGVLLSLPRWKRRETWLFLTVILYATGIFALTDATPRYLMPLIFCYCVLAGIGFDLAWRKLRGS